ncbi:lipid transferase CIDEA [Thomomys bottae]
MPAVDPSFGGAAGQLGFPGPRGSDPSRAGPAGARDGGGHVAAGRGRRPRGLRVGARAGRGDRSDPGRANGMEIARDCAGALIRPLTFMGSQTKRVLLTPITQAARPFRVSNHDRSSRRGIMASSLQELISKTLDALVIAAGLVTLVLEEDGTVVDTEEFFQSLGDNTHFMILEKGQKWTPGSKYVPAYKQPKKSGIAKVTFDLYRLNPKDFLGCLNVKATMYEMYSVSYDIRCTGFKAMLRSLLRFMSYAAQVTGQFLIYMGTYMLRALGDTEQQPVPKSQVKGCFMYR